MFPTVRLVIAAVFASVFALSCGFGVFAAFRVNHEPLTRLSSVGAPLQLVAETSSPVRMTLARSDSADLQDGGAQRGNVGAQAAGEPERQAAVEAPSSVAIAPDLGPTPAAPATAAPVPTMPTPAASTVGTPADATADAAPTIVGSLAPRPPAADVEAPDPMQDAATGAVADGGPVPQASVQTAEVITAPPEANVGDAADKASKPASTKVAALEAAPVQPEPAAQPGEAMHRVSHHPAATGARVHRKPPRKVAVKPRRKVVHAVVKRRVALRPRPHRPRPARPAAVAQTNTSFPQFGGPASPDSH